MALNSRDKGKRGERRWRDQLREAGFSAERTGWMQSRGGGDQVPDVDSPDLDIHFEIKTTERLRLRAALDQASRDAGDKPYAVVWQESRQEPVVCMPASHWFAALRGDLIL